MLGYFLHDLANLGPWWVYIISAVDGGHKTTLTDLLSLGHQVGLEFLCSGGVLKRGPKSNTYSVLYEGLELFMVQEKLQDIMETVNRMSIFRINYGKNENLWPRLIQWQTFEAIQEYKYYWIPA